MNFAKGALCALLALPCLPVHAQEAAPAAPPPAMLVVDDSLKNIEGEVAPSGLDVASMSSSYGINSFGPGTASGLSYGQAAGVGLAGGLIAGAIIDGMVHAERNRAISAIREPLGKGRMRGQILRSLSRHLAAQGYPVGARVIAPDASERIVDRATAKEKPERLVLFDTVAAPFVTLASDDRSVIVRGELALMHRERNEYARQRRVRAAYVSLPAPEGDPKGHWSANEAQAVLDAVDAGLGEIIRLSMTLDPALLADVPKDAKVDVLVDGEPRPVSGRLVAQTDTHLALATRGDTLLILPGRLAPAPSAASPAASASP